MHSETYTYICRNIFQMSRCRKMIRLLITIYKNRDSIDIIFIALVRLLQFSIDTSGLCILRAKVDNPHSDSKNTLF